MSGEDPIKLPSVNVSFGNNPVGDFMEQRRKDIENVTGTVKDATGGLIDPSGTAKNAANILTRGMFRNQIYGRKQFEEIGLTAEYRSRLEEIAKDPTASAEMRDRARRQLQINTDSIFPLSEVDQYLASREGRKKQGEMAKLFLQHPGQRQTLLTDGYATGAGEQAKRTLLGGE